MLENLFSNVFGRTKNKPSGRNSQSDASSGNHGQMTGPFSMPTPQMPQPPNSLYPATPYPLHEGHSTNQPPSFYPRLPFQQPSSMPTSYGSGSGGGTANSHYGTLVHKQLSPLDSVPFEAKLTLNNSTNLVSLDQLFKEIKQAADVVERADEYLKSAQSDYDFRIEQNLIHQ